MQILCHLLSDRVLIALQPLYADLTPYLRFKHDILAHRARSSCVVVTKSRCQYCLSQLPCYFTPASTLPTLGPAPALLTSVILACSSHPKQPLPSAQHHAQHITDQHATLPQCTVSYPGSSVSGVLSTISTVETWFSQAHLGPKPPQFDPAYLGCECGFWAKLGVAWCFSAGGVELGNALENAWKMRGSSLRNDCH
jgi:hypothetical protein